ncbi:MAG: DUF6531 domain-containing protein, partial [Vulcanimicrobiaceae bacterium]
PLAASTTGINRWWTYEEEGLPGVGRAMVNVANGNLLVQADDVDLHERGIDLAFRRTYNSQSGHDMSNSDGSVASNYGNGWTNTFDAHLGYDAASNVMSIYDIDGARYNYTANGQGQWVAPAGVHATLVWDGGCGYLWTKTTGTTYYFWAPNYSQACGAGTADAGYNGRLYMIFARNHDNWVRFNYSWTNGNASSAANVAQIVAQQSDGQALTLNFADFNGHRELATLALPNGQQIAYQYDASGDLIEVDRPGYTAGTTLAEVYQYAAPHALTAVESPRYVAGSRANGGGATDGNVTSMAYDGSGRLTQLSDTGVVNFTPGDGVNQLLQPGLPSGVQPWHTTTFSYGSGSTALADSDGHAATWAVDSLGRVTQTQHWTGTLWLVTNAQWDGNNNLVASIGVRGNETDYAYDANGDTIAVGLPAVATSLGYFRPTSRYTYDADHNVTSYCDPVWVHENGGDWGSGGNPCTATSAGVVRYTWDTSDAAEPFGRLSSTTTPLGYQETFQYNPADEDGDFGLPTEVLGQSISQADGTTRTPQQTFHYDADGNLIAYSTGTGSWALTYDALNRLTSATDPDGITSYKSYYANGALEQTATAYQHATNTGITYTYDADGDEVSVTHAHGGTYNYGSAPTLATPLTTEKFYDGADRLVEVVQPHDAAHDVYSNPWTTRYLYDLSQNGRDGTPTFDGQAISAHGNLYKTQELLPAGGPVVTWTDSYGALPAMANTQFQELKGTAFDALGRPTAAYAYVNRGGSSDALNLQTSSYDASPATYGLLAQHCNDLGQCATLGYDALGRTTSVTFNDPATPNRTTVYDPDGRVASVTSSLFGTASYAYDAAGDRITSTEATGGGVTSPATISHSYYPNGALEAVSVASSGLNQSNLFTYSYDTPGQMQTLAIDDGNVANVAAAGTTALHFTYNNAGQLVERTETGAGANLTPETRQYDSTDGFLTGEQVPGGSLSAFEYSGQGELLGRVAQVAGAASSHLTTLTYTTRGELVTTMPDQLAMPGQRGTPPPDYADGVLVQVPGGGTTSWDSAMGVPLGTDTQSSSTGVSFDAAGRLVSESSYSESTTLGGATSVTHTQTTRSYDAENHLLSTQYVSQGKTYDAALIEYGWGPSGHPLRIGSAQNIQRTAGNWTPPTAAQVQYDTLHWDGSQLLFETNPAGQVDAINVGTLGAILPLDPGYNGLT